MNKSAAELEIRRVFRKFAASPVLPGGPKSSSALGKIYELYCLALFLEELRADGFKLLYRGAATAKFKASPGRIKTSDPHFEIEDPKGAVVGKIWLNIEFMTLGHAKNGANDRSRKHELDIVVTVPNASGRPAHDELLVGIECKSTANFGKRILKEVLGARRELSLLCPDRLSPLSKARAGRRVFMPADPPTEYYVCHVDPVGQQYRQSAAFFGVTFRHWEP